MPHAVRRLTAQGGDRRRRRSNPSTEAQSLRGRRERQASSGLVTGSLRRAIVEGMRACYRQRRALDGAWVRLERSAGKVAGCVLRGVCPLPAQETISEKLGLDNSLRATQPA